MRLPVYQCDLCKQRHEEKDFWWNNANGGAFTVCRDGINGSMKWEHLCPKCRVLLHEAVMKVCDQFRVPEVPS